MTMTYRTAGAWGAGKGGDLTPAEVDVNFHSLVLALAALEADIPAPAEIEDITLAGTVMTITLSDATSYAVTVPRAAFTWRGAWAGSTAYLGNDVVQVPGYGIYLVRATHTSPATWDEGHLVGGQPAYLLMFSDPRAVVATASGATLTPALSQAFAYIRCTAAGGCAVTLPSLASVPFPVGTELHFAQRGAAAVTIAGAAGVTVNVPDGLLAETNGPGSVVTAKKVASDEWDLFGALVAV